VWNQSIVIWSDRFVIRRQQTPKHDFWSQSGTLAAHIYRIAHMMASLLNHRLLFVHALQLLLFAGLIVTTDYCCDAGYYIEVGNALLREGLFVAYPYDGHRSYLTPLLAALIHKLPFAALFSQLVEVAPTQIYGINVAFVWSGITWACLRLLSGGSVLPLRCLSTCSVLPPRSLSASKLSPRHLLAIGVLGFCNPVLLAYLVLPMQESIMLLIFVPCLILLSCGLASPLKLALAIALSGYAYMVRESYAFVALPLLLLWLLPLLRKNLRSAPQSKPAIATALVLIFGLALPQVIRNNALHQITRPYHSQDVQNLQLEWGARMYKYNTERINGEWKGVEYRVPEHARTALPNLISALQTLDARALPIVGSHVLTGLVHEQAGAYGPASSTAANVFWQLFSAITLALGMFGIVDLVRAKDSQAVAVMLGSLLGLSMLYTAFVAAETRFGIIGFIALTLAAVDWLSKPHSVRANAIALAMIALCASVVLTWSHLLSTTRVIL
jgi:hypothetical protein